MTATRTAIDTHAIGGAPVVKWPGGKTKLLPELMRHAPASFGRYHEPFAGGAAMFFALAREGRLAHGATLSDVNPDLINLYRALAWDVEGVIDELDVLERQHRKAPVATYRRIRNERNRQLKHYLRDPNQTLAYCDDGRRWAAIAIYLNRTCFNGLWRVNRSGAFNVPLGAYAHRRIDITRADQLRAAARELAGRDRWDAGVGSLARSRDEVRIQAQDFLAALAVIRSGDLVFCDPPYFPTSATASFAAYAIGGFGLEQQRDLASALNTLAYRGVHVIASNADTPLAREVYAPYRDALTLTTIQAARAINSRGSKRGTVGELVITSRRSPVS